MGQVVRRDVPGARPDGEARGKAEGTQRGQAAGGDDVTDEARGGGVRGTGGPADEGEALFRAAVDGARPLADRERVLPQPLLVAPRQGHLGSRLASGSIQRVGASLGASPGVNDQTLRELAGGRMPPEAVIDLHRNTSEVARERVARFLADSRVAGHRVVLVITGRGDRSPRPDTLRELTPEWLAGPLGSDVLAFCPARPQDGGAGALYVLLRRVRTAPRSSGHRR